jgi:hypothetical protein
LSSVDFTIDFITPEDEVKASIAGGTKDCLPHLDSKPGFQTRPPKTTGVDVVQLLAGSGWPSF